ncbi:hypothetical protein [Planococcus salinus]|uniref:Uncharacterized protein n=1 Tax=Planococcus salinus TaxID=1848460 RepID=A0A3M8PA52_9BACL|nr:hypothetical protein [Planococcus salinus]RNF40558.1 hypothetical protein EEX84_03800 [Planococcus salinus]
MKLTINGKTLNEEWSNMIVREITRETKASHPMEVEEYLKDYTVEENENAFILRPPTAEGIHIKIF